jgi:hypothetical protein
VASFINFAGLAVVLGGLYVMLFGRGRAIEGYLAFLAAIGVVIIWGIVASPYSTAAGAAFFGIGLIAIGATALLMRRLAIPEGEE